MRVLICYDDGQLRRVESAIMAIESAQPCYRHSKEALLKALQIERASLLQFTKHPRGQTDRMTIPERKRPTRLKATPVHDYVANA